MGRDDFQVTPRQVSPIFKEQFRRPEDFTVVMQHRRRLHLPTADLGLSTYNQLIRQMRDRKAVPA
jgi:hypothetical protein